METSNKKDIFQYVVIGAFLVLGVISVIIFATYKAKTSSTSQTQMTLWGTLPQATMAAAFKDLADAGVVRVTYTQLPAHDYYESLTRAFAENRGPDLYMIDQSALIHEKPKLTFISYKTLSERGFLDTYADVGTIYKFQEGIYGLPLSIDPLVMFWNRDLFTNAGLVEPPKYWDEFLSLVPKLTQRTQDGKITKSTVAMGTYKNITNAQAILSTLLLQAGSQITQLDQKGKLAGALSVSSRPDVVNPVDTVLRFYTQFSNSVNTAYSWHEAMPASRDAFLAGDLAVYFGFASEASALRAANPNLNFDMAVVPQARNAPRRITYAHVYALVIPKTSKDPYLAYSVATALTGAKADAVVVAKTGLPPARRDLLAQPQGGAYWSVAYNSAVIAKAWLEPDPLRTTDIFSDLVDSVTSGRVERTQAVSIANRQLQALGQ